MGLDMYLSKKTYIGANYKHNNVKGKIDLKKGDKEIKIKLERVSYIEEQIGYWRKANHIHNYFVNTIQDGEDDCEDYELTLEVVKDLLDRCEKVKKSLENSKKHTISVKNGWNKDGDTFIDIECFSDTELAIELLPPSSGFFFGGTEIDDWYLENINTTIEILKTVLEENGNDEYLTDEYYYSSSW